MIAVELTRFDIGSVSKIVGYERLLEIEFLGAVVTEIIQVDLSGDFVEIDQEVDLCLVEIER